MQNVMFVEMRNQVWSQNILEEPFSKNGVTWALHLSAGSLPVWIDSE